MSESFEKQTVGIVTLCGRFNYGNRLQAYAVQRSISRLGYAPLTLESVNIKPERRVKNVVKKLLGRPVRIEETLSQERRDAFERFETRISTKRFSIRDHTIGKGFVACISGSDQVWNPRFMSYGHPEMLKFIEPRKRIALSASIGASKISKKDIGWFSQDVAEFRHISVRERVAADIVKECAGRTAKVLMDPTLSLKADEWRAISDNRHTPTGDYVLACLFGSSSGDGEIALAMAAANTSKIIHLTDRERDGELPAGPAEFISLIDNARHVVSDSYHASVFAMLMGTPLTIVQRVGSATECDMFSRLESLAQMFCLDKNIYGSPSFDIRALGDYERSYDCLRIERERYEAFLKEALEDVG